MNEELRIIIKAVTSEAQKALGKVRADVKEINNAAKEAGKSLKESFSAAAKSAAIAVAAITAVVGALVKMGQSTDEYVKAQARLSTSFRAAGHDGQAALKTYQQLYRFLGDTNTATEAATLISKLTTNTADLTEWTKILQGVYATFPDSIPVEGLAEAANETIKTGKVTGNLADALNWLGVSEDAVNDKLSTMNSLQERELFLRSTLNSLYGGAAAAYERNNSAMIALNESQARLDAAMAETAAYLTPLRTELNNVAASLVQVLKPAFETVSAVIIVFSQWIIAAIQYIGSFFGLFGEKGVEATKAVSSQISAIKNNSGSIADGFEEGAKAADKLKKATMGFDELNIISNPNSSSSDSGGGDGKDTDLSIPSISDIDFEAPGLTDFQNKVDEVRESLKILLPIAAGIGAVFAGVKLAGWLGELGAAKKVVEEIVETILQDFDGTDFKDLPKDIQKGFTDAKKSVDDMYAPIKRVSGIILIIAGLALSVKGFLDAWKNGIDWGNLAEMIGGIALALGGVALVMWSVNAALVPLAVGLASIVAGVLLVVVGIKDLVTNGYSMEAVLTVLAGVILVVVGVCLAFNAALLANPITWIVLAIAALVAAFVILWNECDGFRNFWINLWENIKKVFNTVVNALKVAVNAIVQFFVDAWEWIKDAWSNVKSFFSGLWDGIKAVFSVVKEVLGGFFSAAWDGIKSVWDKVLDFFKTLWNGIKSVFSAVGSFFKNAFTTAWEGIKNVFNKVTGFFSGIWDSIKRIFSNVGSAIGNAITNTVKTAINSVLSTAVGIINGFISAINFAIGVINAIPGVNIKTLNKLSVPKLAKGGIVDRATLAVVGEAGKEAVVPLENNTEWMDKLAERIAARNTSPSKIVLQVGEKELGWATIGAINGITTQTGKVQLTI